MSLLPQIERELLEAHERQADRRLRRARGVWSQRARSRRTGLVAVLVGLALAGGATAARELFVVSRSIPPAPQPYAIVIKGAPPHVGPTPAEAAAMLRQIGRPEPQTARAYVSERDPLGGPPWGLLVYRTTTGTICEHAGRVVYGQVGLLDGHGGLHPWTTDLSGCVGWGMAVHGIQAQGGNLAQDGAPTCLPDDLFATSNRPARACPSNLFRVIAEGVLPTRNLKRAGPAAVAVTFSGPGDPTVTEMTPNGAFVYIAVGFAGFRCSEIPSMTIRYSDTTTSRQSLIPIARCPRKRRPATAG